MDPEPNYVVKRGFNGHTTTIDMVCRKCGVVVENTFAHDAFHDRVDPTA